MRYLGSDYTLRVGVVCILFLDNMRAMMISIPNVRKSSYIPDIGIFDIYIGFFYLSDIPT